MKNITALILFVVAIPFHSFGQTNAFTLEDMIDSSTVTTGAEWTVNRVMNALNETNQVHGTFTGDGSAVSNVIASSGRILIDTFTWVMAGSVDTDTEVDGFRAAYTSGIIKSITFSLTERGRNGDTIVDINMFTNAITIITNQVNATVGATVYTNQANRPTLIGDTATRTVNAAIRAALPDITNFPMGARFTIDVDEDVTQNDGLSVDLTVIYDEPE